MNKSIKSAIKLIFAMLLFCLCLEPQNIWAHPPTEILLEYKTESQVLMIAIKHVSSNLRQHHIRKIQIFKNEQQEPVNIYLNTQTTPTEINQEVPIAAVAGDTIRVKAICKEAGYKEEILKIE